MSLLPLLVPPECLVVAVNAVVLLLLPREEECDPECCVAVSVDCLCCLLNAVSGSLYCLQRGGSWEPECRRCVLSLKLYVCLVSLKESCIAPLYMAELSGGARGSLCITTSVRVE